MALKGIITGSVAAIAVAGSVQAQQLCMPRDALVDTLQSTFSESLIGQGLQSSPTDSRLFEVFMSTDGQSWTIIATRPSGLSCIMAAGTDWLVNEEEELAGIPG